MDALATPLFKSILFATVLSTAGLGKLLTTECDQSVTRRLALHTEVLPNAIYLTAWRDGDVSFTFPDSKLHPITFYNRASIHDGCRWLGTETLTPIDSKTFHYDYTETVIECEPGSTPFFKTPRTGLVTVED
jgi:hypothetical protein